MSEVHLNHGNVRSQKDPQGAYEDRHRQLTPGDLFFVAVRKLDSPTRPLPKLIEARSSEAVGLTC
jgi:hypothetical protein